MKKLNRFILAVEFIAALGIFTPALTQVNTENLRKNDLSHGFHTAIQFDVSAVSGNSEFSKLTGSARTDWISKRMYLFGVVKYQRGIQANKVFLNKGFIHIRSIHRVTRFLYIEEFIQKEFNDFILLIGRNLAGTGLRTALIRSEDALKKSGLMQLYLGNGFMWENEKINSRPIMSTDVFRSTNYLSFCLNLDPRVALRLVGYYQVRMINFNDYRILLESGLVFNLTKSLTFQTAIDLRYDNEPPKHIKRHDLELTNGIRITF
ncbi:DUF481 domain-containing protein [candidate division KSB1 bacterium]|nr:DUF481 domain-containing protein [candidate division KSB1 bacterium]